MLLPKINIQYGRLIDPFFVKAALSSHPDWQVPTHEEVLAKVELFKATWEKQGTGLLQSITSLTGLNFSRGTIDVYVVSGTSRDISNPVIIRSRYSEDEFVEILVHELLHHLFGHNKEKVFPNKFLVKEFPDENDTVINHILTYSVLQEMGFKTVPKDESYLRAWEIAKKHPIKEFREYLVKKYS